RRRKGQVAAQHHADRARMRASRRPLTVREELPVDVLADRLRQLRLRASNRAGFAAAQFLGPLLPGGQTEAVLERAEERVIVEPLAMARGKVLHACAFVAVRGEITISGLEEFKACTPNGQTIAQRHARELAAHSLDLRRLDPSES